MVQMGMILLTTAAAAGLAAVAAAGVAAAQANRMTTLDPPAVEEKTDARAAAQAGSNTVYVFRHCVRSIDTSSLDAYSKHAFPSWGVPKDTCLPRGLDIMQGVGRHLSIAGVRSPMLVSDDVPRNIASARAMATGLGMSGSAVEINGSAFVRCPAPSDKEKTKLISKRLKDARPPSNSSAIVAAIDRALGGKKKIAAQKVQVDGGKLKGRISLASMAAVSDGCSSVGSLVMV